MFSTFDDGTLCIFPICYHPMTIMLVDDDPDFLKQLSNQLSDQLPVITFTDPDKATYYFEHQNAFLFKKWMSHRSDNTTLIQDTRKEIYNPNRFKEIVVSIIDYDMPNKTGFDIINTMGKQILHALSFHSYILLTGKSFSDFNKDLADSQLGKNFVSKRDPNRVNQLLDCIDKNTSRSFQWMGYDGARELSREQDEQTNFLFDGNFLPIFNDHIQKNNICELYLFDKQGSYLFLDENANLSWFFVRNNQGMANSIELAKQYHAPTWVIDAIQSKEKLLSLYEKEDFERIKTINWENYLLPATVFSGDDKFVTFFKMNPHSDYYYAFTDNFVGHDIDQKKILSYRSYLNSLD